MNDENINVVENSLENYGQIEESNINNSSNNKIIVTISKNLYILFSKLLYFFFEK